ncbi:hypothetical protein Thimo_2265 [Thioflavicoccus mobilis 8321]|uniref:Uncharacterized protein n=1 Tax=Thioflavicoccus mobilis 8321 TaxID=765912 RepID=L0H070_9GAMM|nr:hypothetical protein [Thioflavicoccus mobilis]AGA91010.1 hypothetical protein Thimo_2265 [Thioflavicoccus mobilis 8321]
MRLAERERGLLDLVAKYRDEECRRRIEQARTEARALLDRTFAEERAYLHSQIEAERHRARTRIEAVRADRDTRLRHRGERLSAGRLAAAWPRLEAALLARWGSALGRRGWAEHFLRLASERLPRPAPNDHWVIRHAPDWTETERRALVVDLGLGLGHRPRFIADGDLVAGLTVACGGAVLDASLEGLLRDRTRLEARLLALLEGVGGSAAAGRPGASA